MPPPRLLTLPNLLSFSRVPLAVAFVMADRTPTKVALVGAASITDMLDGWLARRGQTTQLGALLDPIADKTFVLAALSSFLFAGVLSVRDYFIVLSRDFGAAIGFLVAYLLPGLDPGRFTARLSGKVVTSLQLAVLFVLVLRPQWMRWAIWPIAAASLWAITDYTLQLHRERVRSRM
ncbi:MAG TPA: CDP-alcohol phosphatidyltransferase family protein [Gemmatimonadaceae bacterium]|nr:CDP-alcohol phosphatidyltransferase family protein [Gemmatimonadaceae bacterium]